MQTNAKNNVYLKADENVRYGMVAEVMARVKAAGISGLGIITEPPRKPQEQENQ
jgi:biopolymer transport protein ExbD